MTEKHRTTEDTMKESYYHNYGGYRYHIASEPGADEASRYSWHAFHAGTGLHTRYNYTLSGVAATRRLAHDAARYAITRQAH